MRLAFVTETYPPELNGVAGTVARAVDWLRARGHHVHLVRPRQTHEAPYDGTDEWRAPGFALPMYRALRVGLPSVGALRHRWLDLRPELVHVATEGPLGWAACRAGRSLGLPVTSDLRTHFDLYSDYYGFGFMRGVVGAYLRRFHSATDLTFAPTAALAVELRARFYGRVDVLGRGVDATRFAPFRRNEALRRAWGAGPEDPVVLHVGRLAAEKNLPLAMRAFSRIQAQAPRAVMVVIGEGPLRRSLERNAGPGVKFAGQLRGDALAEHYASGDVFIFPSLTETFGNVTLEALASGLVVVAFNLGAAGVHITHRVNGFVADGGNAEEFVQLACRAVAELPRLQVVRTLARQAALATSWDNVLSRFEERLMTLRNSVPLSQPAYAA